MTNFPVSTHPTPVGLPIKRSDFIPPRRARLRLELPFRRFPKKGHRSRVYCDRLPTPVGYRPQTPVRWCSNSISWAHHYNSLFFMITVHFHGPSDNPFSLLCGKTYNSCGCLCNNTPNHFIESTHMSFRHFSHSGWTVRVNSVSWTEHREQCRMNSKFPEFNKP